MSLKSGILWGVLDQSLQSLVNLSVGLILIRYSSKEEYGMYGIGFASLLLLIGISNALVSSQMTVIAPLKEFEYQDRFSCGLVIGFFKYYIFILFFIFAVLELCKNYFGIYFYNELIYILMVISPSLILQEIYRAYLYMKQDSKKVFVMDFIYALVYAFELIYIIIFNVEKKHLYIFAANGFAAVVSLIICLSFFKINCKGSLRNSSNCLKEAWQGGKWALGGVLVTWGQNQGYIYILALLKGSEYVAEANAARLFLAPVGVISTSIAKVVMPRLVRLRGDNNFTGAISIARKALIIVLVFTALYLAGLSLSIDWVFDKFIVNNNYGSIWIIIQMWSVYFICQSFRNNNSIILQAFRLFKKITLSNLIVAIIVLGACYVLVVPFAVQGVILTMSVGEIILAIVFWKIYKDERYKHQRNNS